MKGTIERAGYKLCGTSQRIKELHEFRPPARLPPGAVVKTITFKLKIIEYEFCGGRFRFSVPAMSLIAFVD